MKITPDTNVLLRAMTGDDARQAKVSRAELAEAEIVALTLPTLCELVWVLARGYKTPTVSIADGIRRLINATNVTVNRPAVEAGLALLDAGGDFADGAIAFEGGQLGGEVLVSFDKKAVRLLQTSGETARLLS
jgi:predicted nucleic-acid-binding protein